MNPYCPCGLLAVPSGRRGWNWCWEHSQHRWMVWRALRAQERLCVFFDRDLGVPCEREFGHSGRCSAKPWLNVRRAAA